MSQIHKSSHSPYTSHHVCLGIRDQRFYEFIGKLLGMCGLHKSQRKLLQDRIGMQMYERVFTHHSVHEENNYEYFELLGDVTLNKCILWYVANKFPELQNVQGVKVLSRLRINLVSWRHLSQIAKELEFSSFISFHEEIKEIKYNSILEDVLEAFIGCTELLIDTKICPGAGYSFCFEFVSHIMNQKEISLHYEDLYDPITRLKETFDYFRNKKNNHAMVTTTTDPSRTHPMIWGEMVFENVRIDSKQQVSLYQQHSRERKEGRVLLGSAIGTCLDETKQEAAQKALDFLKQHGCCRPIPEFYQTLSKKNSLVR